MNLEHAKKLCPAQNVDQSKGANGAYWRQGGIFPKLCAWLLDPVRVFIYRYEKRQGAFEDECYFYWVAYMCTQSNTTI